MEAKSNEIAALELSELDQVWGGAYTVTYGDLATMAVAEAVALSPFGILSTAAQAYLASKLV